MRAPRGRRRERVDESHGLCCGNSMVRSPAMGECRCGGPGYVTSSGPREGARGGTFAEESAATDTCDDRERTGALPGQGILCYLSRDRRAWTHRCQCRLAQGGTAHRFYQCALAGCPHRWRTKMDTAERQC